MSLIDTMVLGRQPGMALQLAALGPCSLVLNFANYAFAALIIATVQLVSDRLKRHAGYASSSSGGESSLDEGGGAAGARAGGGGGDGRGGGGAAGVCEPAAAVLSAALFVALAGGLAVLALLGLAGPDLLAATGADASLLPPAATYLRIRALGAPAQLAMQVAQAGLLAQRDSLTPFRVVALTSGLSLAGDLLLVAALGLGLAGAAWTTIAAQYLGAALLLAALRRTAVPPRLRLPAVASLRSFFDAFGILTVFYLAKTSCYLLLQSAAARLPPLLLAAHQPVWQLWNLVAFMNTPLEQAALAFLPAAPSRADRNETARLIAGMGAAGGAVEAAVAVGLPQALPALFVADAALWGPMRSVGLQGVVAMLCCGMDVAATGCLLALKDTGFVARAMAICLALLAALLYWLRQQGEASLSGVWWGLAAFFFFRAAQSLPRLLGLTAGRRRLKGAGVAAVPAAAGGQPS